MIIIAVSHDSAKSEAQSFNVTLSAMRAFGIKDPADDAHKGLGFRVLGLGFGV